MTTKTNKPEVLGVLCTTTDPDGKPTFSVLNPNRYFTVLEPELAPKQWLPVIAQLMKTDGITPISLVVEVKP